MRGFYWGTGVVRCGFCGTNGHNITTCKVVPVITAHALLKIQKDSSYIFTIDELRAFHEIKRRENKLANKITRKRKQPRCSFCRELDHRRPKCNKFKDFKKLVYEANIAWKKSFVNQINKCGLGVGALIRLHKDSFFGDYTPDDNYDLGIIMEYNYKNTNVFCAIDSSYDYQSNSSFKVMVAERVHNIHLKNLSVLLGENLLRAGWWTPKPPEVINPMLWEPSEEWVMSEHDEVLEWFFSNISQEKTERTGLHEFIESWANKT
tara:strand:+ start:189 stop:977 length:789 start_codon:yes stop_codon:yes gene_type:complete